MNEEKTTETVSVEINKKMLAVLNDVADSDGISVSDVVKKANWRANNTNAFVLPPEPVDDESEESQ